MGLEMRHAQISSSRVQRPAGCNIAVVAIDAQSSAHQTHRCEASWGCVVEFTANLRTKGRRKSTTCCCPLECRKSVPIDVHAV
eukprot:5105019-Amphidinium_carterae.2